MIFGGFLLKTTFELAFTCASSMSHTRPTFIALDPSTFENPVPVGSVLYLTVTVAYTDSPLLEEGTKGSETGKGLRDLKTSPEGTTRVQIRVDSKVKSMDHDGEVKGTGVFSMFKFCFCYFPSPDFLSFSPSYYYTPAPLLSRLTQRRFWLCSSLC